nr:hypothetical protein [Tanacetum cinerariifolium]
MSNMPIALRCLLVDRYNENDFLLEEQELNDLRVSLEDAKHLFEVTISKKLHVCELLCKMEGSCSVCLKKYKEGEELGILHCSHEFHTDCIKIWLLCKKCLSVIKKDLNKAKEKMQMESVYCSVEQRLGISLYG